MLAEADRDGDGKVTFKAPKPKRLEIPHGRTSSSSCPSPERLTAPPRRGHAPKTRPSSPFRCEAMALARSASEPRVSEDRAARKLDLRRPLRPGGQSLALAGARGRSWR